jgi:hypothetical protein
MKMNNNVRIAKQLVRIAKELVGTKHDGEIVRTNIADTAGFWKDFRGTLLWKGIHASVAAKKMSLNDSGSKYLVSWYGGTWNDGNADNVWWKEGQWKNGTFTGGMWISGTWNGGTWKGGYDANGQWHNEGDSPDKWGAGDPSSDPSNNHWIICQILDDGKEKIVNTFKMNGTESEDQKVNIFEKRLNRVGFAIPMDADIFDGDNGTLVVRDFDGKTLFVMKKNPKK